MTGCAPEAAGVEALPPASGASVLPLPEVLRLLEQVPYSQLHYQHTVPLLKALLQRPDLPAAVLGAWAEPDRLFATAARLTLPHVPPRPEPFPPDLDSFLEEYRKYSEGDNYPFSMCRTMHHFCILAAAVASNPSAPAAALRRLYSTALSLPFWDQYAVLRSLVCNRECPPDLVRRLSVHRDSCIRKGALIHPNLPVGRARTVIRGLLAGRYSEWTHDYAVVLALNPSLPEAEVAALLFLEDRELSHLIAHLLLQRGSQQGDERQAPARPCGTGGHGDTLKGGGLDGP